jgi:glycosyltransferase involved in cell wall biosynthesis
MMRGVAHLSDSASRLAGGMFESIRGLCGSLVTGGRWQPAMFAAKDPSIEQDLTAWMGIPLDVATRGLRGGFLSHRIARSIEEYAPKIVHLHGLWGPASRAALRLTAGQGRPRLVISPRGMLEPWALARSRWKKQVAWHAWNRALVERAAVLHALCDEEAVSLARLVPNVPICVIPNGIHLPELRDSDQLVRSGEVLLFLGRIHPKKGLEPLIEAWAQVPAAAQSGWRLAIAGWDDGGHQARLSAQARRLAIQDSVLFLGPTFGEAKERVLRSASAFILPSFSEGLPMSVLEAWSFAIPVVMTEECHLGIGFAQGAAIRVEPTVASLAASLADLTLRRSRHELESMGLRGRELVESEFTWQRIGNNMADVYDWAVGGSRPTSVRF